MNKIDNVSKSEQEGLSTTDVITIFRDSDDLETIRNAVKQAKERIFTAWASVDAIDSDNEKIPIDEVIESHKIQIQRGGVIMDTHTNRHVGVMLAYKVLIHPQTKTKGVLELNKIFNHNEVDDMVWKEIVSGERKGMSVGGAQSKPSTYESENGEFFKMLNGFQGYETSTVHSPANKYALNESFSAVAKSEKPVLDGSYFVMNGDVYKINKEGRCWEGYEPVAGKKPYEEDSCQPKKENEYEEVDKAEYNGKDVELNQPMRNSEGDSAYLVYTTHPETGNTIRVKFGDADMDNNRDDEEARSSFRARHQCDNKTFEKDRHTAGYWSCKFWSSTPVRELLKEDNVLNQTHKSNNTGENTMAEEQADILDVAMQKMEAGETLNEEEKSAIKGMYGNRQKQMDEEKPNSNEDDTEKADGKEIGQEGGDSQPEDNTADAANEQDVVKQLETFKSEILKSVKDIVSESLKQTSVAKGQKVGTSPSASLGKQTTKSKTEESKSFVLDIAKGSKRLTWNQLEQEVKKMRGFE